MDCFFLSSFRGLDLRNNIMINEMNIAENLDEFQGMFPEYDECMPLYKAITTRAQDLQLTLTEVIILKAMAFTSPGKQIV